MLWLLKRTISIRWFLFEHPIQMLKDSKTCLKRPSEKRSNIGFQDQLLLNAGQKYCRMLQEVHSAILLTFIKLPFAIKIFVLSIFKWPFYTGFTVDGWENNYNFMHKSFLIWTYAIMNSWATFQLIWTYAIMNS